MPCELLQRALWSSPPQLASGSGRRELGRPCKYLHGWSSCRKKVAVNEPHPAGSAPRPGPGSLLVAPGSRDHARSSWCPCQGGLRGQEQLFPSMPSVGSGRPRPAGGRQGAPAAMASLVLTFPSCFHWQRAPADVVGSPLSGAPAGAWFPAAWQLAQVSAHFCSIHCIFLVPLGDLAECLLLFLL